MKKIRESANAGKACLQDLHDLWGCRNDDEYDKAIDSLVGRIINVLSEFRITDIDIDYVPGTLELEYGVAGHWENDGIGPYEYWGVRGYDKGVDYFVADDYRFDMAALSKKLADELGVELDFENDDYDAEVFDEENARAVERRKVDIYIVDPEKAGRAAGLNRMNALGEARKRGTALNAGKGEVVDVPAEFRRMLYEECEMPAD